MSDSETLRNWRELLKLSKPAFAKEMGVSLRAYEELEAGRTEVRHVNMQAARYALARFCAEGKISFDDLPWDVQETFNGIMRNKKPAG